MLLQVRLKGNGKGKRAKRNGCRGGIGRQSQLSFLQPDKKLT